MNISSVVKFYFLCVLLVPGCEQKKNPNNKILSDIEIYAYGHKYSDWFYSYQLDSLVACIADESYSVLDLREFREKVNLQLGKETEVINERIGKGRSKSYFYGYVRYSKFTKSEQPVKTVFSFDSDDNIYTFSVESLPKEAVTRFLNYKTKTKLRLPFNGEWYVSWGGRTINYNQHAVAKDQRFAYDFLIKKDGFTYQNDGSKNEDYFCFDKEIVAPGSGTIVEVVNNIRENKPGEMPKISGNHVIIDHGNDEFSILSHFKKGSIVVKPGYRVKLGQFLGLCGNSGHSSEPHLHYHLQNSAVLYQGEGLPAQFQSYQADGKFVSRGEPFWDQKVQNVNE